MSTQHQTLIFEHKYIAGTVRELQERASRIDDVVEWSNSSAETTQLDGERRIISATLAAIRAEYAPGYFDAGGPVPEVRRVRVAELTDAEAIAATLSVGDGKPSLALIEEMAGAGTLSMDAVGATLSVPGWGQIGFPGSPVASAVRCYLAWKVGEEVEV